MMKPHDDNEPLENFLNQEFMQNITKTPVTFGSYYNKQLSAMKK